MYCSSWTTFPEETPMRCEKEVVSYHQSYLEKKVIWKRTIDSNLLFVATQNLFHILNHIFKKKTSEKDLSSRTYSSWPIYPGGDPIRRETECCSIYSLMSRRTMCRSSSKSSRATTCAECCSVLQFRVVCCSVLQCVAVCCSVAHFT